MLEAPEGVGPVPAPPQVPTLLVVDDDATVRRRICDGLGAGYRFVEAVDGEDALTRIRDAAPDLVLSDVEMPGLNGFELCRMVKGTPSFGFIPFILMTSEPRRDVKVLGLDLGADDFLAKPLDLVELAARVRAMLRLKALQDELRATNAQLQEANAKLRQLSMVDPLTGVYNRLWLARRFSYEYQRAVRYHAPLACLMTDLDHFKRVNDSYGHQVGDAVLRGVSEVIRDALREVDLLARYGGEELVVILPNTPLEAAIKVAERLRAAVEQQPFLVDGQAVRCTLSVGLAAIPDPQVSSEEDLLRLADDALYRAKRNGRNRVEAHRA